MGKKINARVGTPISFDGMQVNIVIPDGKKKISSDDLTGTTRNVNNSDGNNGGGSGNGSNGGQTTIQNITQNITQNQPSNQWQITELAAAVNSVAESMRSGLQELVSMTRGEISALSAFKEWKSTYDNIVNKEGYHRANYSGKQGLNNAIDALKHRDDFDQYVIKKMTDMADSGRGGLMTDDGQWTEKATDILTKAMDARQSSSLAGFVQMSVSALSSLDQRERMFKGKVDPKAQAGKLSLDKKEAKQQKNLQATQQKREDLADKTAQQIDRIQRKSQESAKKDAAAEVDLEKDRAAAQAAAGKKIRRSQKKANDATKDTYKAEVKAEDKKTSQQVKAEHQRAAQAKDGSQDSGPYAGMRWKDFVKKNGDFDTDAIEHYLKSKPNAEEPTMKDVFSATSYLKKQRDAEQEASKVGAATKSSRQTSTADEEKLLRASAKADKQKAASKKREAAAASDEEKGEVKVAADKAQQAKRQAYKDEQGKKKEAGAAKKAAAAREKSQQEQSKKETEAQKAAAKQAEENAQEDSKYDGLHYNDFVTTRIDGTKAFNDNELKQKLKEKTGKEPSQKELITAKNYLRQQQNGVSKQAIQKPAEPAQTAQEQPTSKPEPVAQEQPAPQTKARSKAATSTKAKSKSTKQPATEKSKETRVQKKAEKQKLSAEEEAKAALDAAEHAVTDAEKERRDARIAYKANPTAENEEKYKQARLSYQEALEKRKEATDFLATGKTKEQRRAEEIAAMGIDTSRKAKYDDFVSHTIDGKSTFLDDRLKLWLEAKNGRAPTEKEFRATKAALEKQQKKDEAKAKQKAASAAAGGSKESTEKTGGDTGEQAKRGGGKKKAAVSEEEKLMANMEAAVQKYYKSGPKGQKRALNRLEYNAKRLEELQNSTEDQASKKTKSGKKAKKTGEETGAEPPESKAPPKGRKAAKSAEDVGTEPSESKAPAKGKKRTEVAGNTDTEPPEKKPVAKERKSVKGTESPVSGETRDSTEKPKKKARATDTDKNKQDELRANYESKKYDLEQYSKRAGGRDSGQWTKAEIKLFNTADKNLQKASNLIEEGKTKDAGSAIRIATSQMGQLKKMLNETSGAQDKQRKANETALAADRKAAENEEKERVKERQRSADQLDKEIGDTVKQYSKLTENPMFEKLPKAMQAGVADAIGNLDTTGQAESLAVAQKAIAEASKAIQDQTKAAALTESGQTQAEKSAYYMATRESSRNQLTDMAAIFKATGSAEDLQNYQKALTKVQWEEKAAQLKNYNKQLAMMTNPTGELGVDLSKNWAVAQIAMRDEILKMQGEFRDASRSGNQTRADNILKQIGDKTDLLGESLTQTKKLNDAAKALETTNNWSRVAQGFKDNLAAALNEMNTASSDKFIEKMNAVRTAISNISSEMKQIGLDDYWNQQTAALQNFNSTLQGLTSRNGGQAKWTQGQRDAYAQAQQAYAEAEQAQQARDMGAYQEASKRGNERMNALNQSLTAVGRLSAESKPQVDALSRAMMNFAAPMMLFRKFTGYMKKAAQNVSAIDSQMADLKKVTSNTDAEYQIFLQRTGQHAVQIGSSITDLVATTSTFAHMGYDLNESQALGVTATKFANVGGFKNTTDAADTIIAAIKGFKDLNIGDADEVGDKLTAVANNYAVTATDISEGLRHSASALNVAGNDIDQSTAMITAIAEVTRDAGGAGSALKVLSMRIRGAKAE